MKGRGLAEGGDGEDEGEEDEDDVQCTFYNQDLETQLGRPGK